MCIPRVPNFSQDEESNQVLDVVVEAVRNMSIPNEVDEVGGGQTESYPRMFRIRALEENMHAIFTRSITSWRGNVIINVLVEQVALRGKLVL